MSLYEKLQKASSEEDVKDAYIKALGLKEYQKNLIDIQLKKFGLRQKIIVKFQHMQCLHNLCIMFKTL